MNEDDRYFKRMIRERGEATAVIKQAADNLLVRGFAPINVSFGLSEAHGVVSEFTERGPSKGAIFLDLDAVSRRFGDMPAAKIEEWLRVTPPEFATPFPDPARGSSPADWLWNLAELDRWLDEYFEANG